MAHLNKEQKMATDVNVSAEMLEQFKAALASLSPEEKRALAKDLGLTKRKVEEAIVAPADLSLEDAKLQYMAARKEARDAEAVSREKRQGARNALEILRQVAEREGEELTIKRGRVVGLDEEDEGEEGEEQAE